MRRLEMVLVAKAAAAGAVLVLAGSFATAFGWLTLACTSVVSTNPEVDASAPDAAPDSGGDAGACEWDLLDGGHIVCPVGAPEGCMSPDGCNHCVCYPDLTVACTGLPCE